MTRPRSLAAALLAIHDNGIGFNPGLKRKRVSPGLAGMRECVLVPGGEWDIESSPGRDTTIVAWAPLRRKGT